MTKTRSIISLIIVALVALTIPQAQAGGPNIYANGDNLVIAAGATNAYQDLVLENIQGKLEWGEILGIRVSYNRALTADVAVVCTDLGGSATIATNTMSGSGVWASTALAFPARKVRIKVGIGNGTATNSQTFTYAIFAK
jgi:hypothetical protein